MSWSLIRLVTTFSPSNSFGAQFVPVQLGLCLGGLLSTWSPDAPAPQLWTVADAAALSALLSRDKISKVARSEDQSDRYREAAMLDATNGMLAVTVAGESEPRLFKLSKPQDINPAQTSQDVIAALTTAAQLVADGVAKAVVLERGGLKAPREPYALFTIRDGQMIIEARPAPYASGVWAQILQPNLPSARITAPLADDSLRRAAVLLTEAARTWGVTPWDLALTYLV